MPGIILLDLNMPRMDGREALAEIKADPELRQIPVVVLTTSKAEEDIVRTYDLGVNSFITKPVTFDGLVEVMQTWSRYWFEIVELPAGALQVGDSAALSASASCWSRTTRTTYLIARDLLRDRRTGPASSSTGARPTRKR